MKQRSSLSSLCFVLISFGVASVSAQTCIKNNKYFTPNGTYDANRHSILSSLHSNAATRDGFYNGSIGEEPNRVYAVGMCFPGSSPGDCSDCIKGASDWLKQDCTNQTDAYYWTLDPTLCLVRYSNISFSGSAAFWDTTPNYLVLDTANINSNLTEFRTIWEDLTDSMISAASAARSTPTSSNNHYTANVTALKKFQYIYALMQCTPDISPGDCGNCLRQGVRDYQLCCGNNTGGYVMRPICFFRWQFYTFSKAFGNITLAPPPSPPQPPQSPSAPKDNGSGKISTTTIVAIFVSILVVVFIIVLVLVSRRSAVLCWRRKPNQEIDFNQSGITTAHPSQFDFKTIEAATDKFSRSNKLGQGGFGEVFKGTLVDGTDVAVKRLSKTSDQGAQEFKNEVVLVARLQHKNLVRLLGFCLEGDEKILVYEFVPNKSLDYFLFDPTKQGQLDWSKRYNIVVGITRGILYLHQDSRLTIIHRDHNQSYGYMAPEYVMQGLFSTKSDVYSFGVLALEIICGRKNRFVHQSDTTVENLVTYAWRLWRNGSPLELVDPTISENFQTEEVTRCIHIALLCVQEDPTDRPSLSTINQMLSSNSFTLSFPKTPGFFFTNRRNKEPALEGVESSQSTNRSTSQTINDVTITDLEPR